MLDLNQLKDIAERVAATYLQAVIGLWIAAGVTSFDVSTMKAVIVGALPAALSAIKGYLSAALPVGDASASMVRTSVPPAWMPGD
jgi:hypothetical protein